MSYTVAPASETPQVAYSRAEDAWPGERASWQEVTARVLDAGYSTPFLPHLMVSGVLRSAWLKQTNEGMFETPLLSWGHEG